MPCVADDPLLDKARTLLAMGGMSGTTRDFLEEIVWFGWSYHEEARYFQVARMRELMILFSLN